MASSGVVNFGISYSGGTKFQNVWDISVVDIQLRGAAQEISAHLFQSTAPEATQYLSFQARNKEGSSFQKKLSEKTTDTISISPAMAKTMDLSARIFRIVGAFAQRDDLPIFLEPLPPFSDGKSYMIKIMYQADRLRGTVEEIDPLEIHRQIRLARIYPHSMIFAERQKTELSPDHLEIYGNLEGIVYGAQGWIEQFAKDVKLAPPQNISLYENVARETLRQLVQVMSKESLEPLLKLKKEGDFCKNPSRVSILIEEYEKVQFAAMGLEGYATVMRKTLEAFAGDSAPLHKAEIERMSMQFANRCKRE